MYLMVASLKKQLGLDMSMGKILQILSVNPFQQVCLLSYSLSMMV